jgi:two-component system cell cycle sensor histidine kinase/response regulator CckA
VVTEAANATDAMVLIGRLGSQIDMLVTDVVMPGGSGVDLAEGVHKTRPDLPVLFLSGYAGKELSTRGVELDQRHLLIKPVNHAAFVTRVHELLAEARTRHQE